MTLFLGQTITGNSEVYLNPEWALGRGIGNEVGLSGYTNDDLAGTPGQRSYPYIARLLVRWRISTGKGGLVAPAGTIIPTAVPSHRLVFLAGHFAVSDAFGANTYANNPRTQFMNLALANNVAWDFAQDARGHTDGIAVGWMNPDWALRVGAFRMLTTAGGARLAGDLLRNRGDQVQVHRSAKLLRGKQAAVFRLLGYRNLARMGSYQDALSQAQTTGGAPDVTAVRRNGAVKYGADLNFEQPLADGGATGHFGRWGWNDGATESFCYAEADRTLTFGGQLSGARWKRPQDRVRIGVAQNGLSRAHQDYLAAGGLGLMLGDGRLNYEPERLVEIYYSYQLSKRLALSLDFQHIQNPGCNRDRGPVSVPSVRPHAEF
jgi:carbohydrate-selective porin OprB